MNGEVLDAGSEISVLLSAQVEIGVIYVIRFRFEAYSVATGEESVDREDFLFMVQLAITFTMYMPMAFTRCPDR